MSNSHECPASGCAQRVAVHMLMCRPHWFMVPYNERRAVWAAWGGGAGAGTPEHATAMRDAIRSVNVKLAARNG